MIRQGDTSAFRQRPATTDAELGDYYRALLRSLRTSTINGDPPRLIGVTSCRSGEGVSTVAVNLALHAALDLDEDTLLVDLSASQRSVSGPLGGRVTPGLSDMLLRGVEPSECIRSSTVGKVAVLGAGSLHEDLHAGFDRGQVAALFGELKSAYQFVVVDLPTATSLSGCYDLAAVLDGILLVVEAERVRGQVALHVKEQILKADGKLLGVVFNKRREHVPGWLYRRL